MSGDLIDAFRAEAPADKQAFITALFDKITLWDLSVTDVNVQPTDDGRYRVAMTVATKQFEADGGGRETEVPLDVWLDVAVFGAASPELGESDLPAPLVIEKRRFDTATSTLEFVVDQKAGARRHRSVQQDHRPQSGRQSEARRRVTFSRARAPTT